MPICKSIKDVKTITDEIKEYRKSKMSINRILLNKMFEMENYQEAYKILMDSSIVDENLIATIGMNRKSASYDKIIKASKESKNILSSSAKQKVCAYCRVSTDNEEQMNSFQSQVSC